MPCFGFSLIALVVAILSAFILPLCSASVGWGTGAEKPTPDPETMSHKSRAYLQGRLYGISNTSPMLRGARRVKNASSATRELSAWFALAEARYIKERKRTQDSTCGTPPRQWTESARKALKDRRIGVLDISCMIRIKHKEHVAKRGRKLFRIVSDVWRKASWTVIKESDNIQLKKNWTNSGTFPMARWHLVEDEQQCNIERETAVKRNGVWYLLADVESAPVNKFLGPWGRRRIEEYVSGDLSATLPVFVNGTDSKMRPYSTVQMLWGARGNLSTYYQMKAEELTPLSAAVQQNVVNIGQAREALLASNLAIMFLPLTLSLIPFALVANVNFLSEFVYMLFTDVLSALPLIVKGVEIYQIGSYPSLFGQTWMVGNRNMKVAEAWIVTCRPRTSYRGSGIILICIGSAAIVFGFTIEYIARRYVRWYYSQGHSYKPFISTPDFISLNPGSVPHACVNGTTAGGAIVVVPRPEFEADLVSPPPVDIRPRGRNLQFNEPFAQHFYRRVVRRRHGQGATLTQEFIEVDENCNP